MATTPIIQSVGSGSGAGTPGQGRNDLEIGETVTLSDTVTINTGVSHYWAFEDVPIGSTTAVISDPTAAAPDFIPDVTGSYRVSCVVGNKYSSVVVLAVPLAETGSRIPSFEEKLQYNGGGNTKGWHESLTGFMRETDDQLPKLKVTAADTTPAVLNSKLVAGSGISLAVLTPGVNEQLQITSTASGSASRVATDGDDMAVFRFQEAPGATTFINDKSTGNLTRHSGSTKSGYFGGPFGQSLRFTDNAEVHTADGLFEPVNRVTVSFWAYIYSFAATTNRMVFKNNQPYSGWAGASDVSMYIGFAGSGGVYQLQGAVVTVGSGGVLVGGGDGGYRIMQNMWHHLGITYDGTNVRLYCNGCVVVTSAATSGNINWSSHGPWTVNNRPGGAGDENPLWAIQDLRIAQVARDAAWFQNVYQLGSLKLAVVVP